MTTHEDISPVHGPADPAFEPLREMVHERATQQPEWAGAVAVYHQARLVANLWVNRDDTHEPLQMVYSSTKGVASLCVALLVERAEIDPSKPVAEYWPEFARTGKEHVSVYELLSHQAGVIGLRDGYSLEDYLEQAELAQALADATPWWPPGTAHGYHALTWGTLTEELFRRVSHRSVQEFFTDELAQPNDIQFQLGVADHDPTRLTHSKNGHGFTRDSWAGIERTALNLDGPDFPLLPDFELLPEIAATGPVAVGGIGTARGLAKVYAAAVTGVEGQPPLLSPDTLAKITSPQAAGQDRVLGIPTRFGLGVQLSSPTMPLLGASSFGHDGFAGSIGCCSPDHDIAFGYLTNLIPQPSGGLDPFAQELMNEAIRCTTAALPAPHLSRMRPSD